MKIDFVRSGGLAGLRLALTLDTGELSAEAASRIARLVDAAGFFEFEEAAVTPPPAPDRFEYRLAIESEIWGRHALVLPESAVPDEMHPLLQLLTSLAMRRGRPDDSPAPKVPPTA